MDTELPNSLRYIVDGQGRDTGFAVVREPVRAAHLADFRALAASHRMIGLCSLGPFPLHSQGYEDFGGPPRHADPRDGWRRPFVTACEAWCHCFRAPSEFLPPGVRHFLFSNSDFTDIDRVRAEGIPAGPPEKRWDVVYCCLGHRFYEFQKNWELARACLRRLSREAGLRVLVVGRADSPDLPRLPGVEVHEALPMPWDEFLRCVARSRLVLFPDRYDASPRALAEALALDVPVLVNRRILGGWKYVTESTGAFFDDDQDVADAAVRVLSADLRPYAWFSAHYGRDRAERRFAALLGELSGDPAAAPARARLTGSL
ncbi:glycosyltransferase [Streptomyces niveiscabiei]|uniref:Glycosyltransferase n=1 Tax=Streptomyces niveiscabiei TaxID=164115 RepID=A0ABW9HKB7_9ACTN